MIPKDHENQIIVAGLHFMRSITEAYGPEEGMKLWDAIADTLDPDVKGRIFFAMISGTHNDTIVLHDVRQSSNAVSCIKEIRTWTGYGLKEAKDAFDLVRSKQAIQIKVRPTEYHRATEALRNVGFAV